ncbi:WYL domain-containing protein [Shewanella sp. SE1]|uniref:WYL domain-containing protein n=1 Tax=Shewanella sp. SE1 TaxID=2705014 RepID=UPI00138EFB85|nr:WYL domain-containing protein [Shewanella sp. SE1]NDO76133.1 WYL domain-containing protein [Shewanella sp. SE1]
MSELEAKVVWKGTTKPVEFTYRNFDGEKTRRRVDVNQVLYDSNADEVYLKGFCHLRNSERSFKVSNIETMLKCGSKRFYWEEWLRWELDLPFDAFQNIDPNTNHGSGDGMFINGRTGEVSVRSPVLSNAPTLNERLEQRLAEAKATAASKHPIASKLVKPLWAFVFIVGGLALVGGMSGKEQSASSKTVTTSTTPEKQVYQGPLTDCQLAAQMVEADVPVLVALVDEISKAKKTPEYSYQDFTQWRINGFNAELDAVAVSQPSAFPLDYQASRLANDVIVRNHLLANAAYRYLKNGRQDGDQKIGEQWQAIRTNIIEINTLCPGALDNLNITP